MYPAASTSSRTTPLMPMATGTASPSTVACATARTLFGTAWYAALSEVRDVPSLKVRSATRAATISTNTIVAPAPWIAVATMIAATTVSTPSEFAVRP